MQMDTPLGSAQLHVDRDHNHEVLMLPGVLLVEHKSLHFGPLFQVVLLGTVELADLGHYLLLVHVVCLVIVVFTMLRVVERVVLLNVVVFVVPARSPLVLVIVVHLIALVVELLLLSGLLLLVIVWSARIVGLLLGEVALLVRFLVLFCDFFVVPRRFLGHRLLEVGRLVPVVGGSPIVRLRLLFVVLV